MTMEAQCRKFLFPKYSKKKSVEDTLVPPFWGKREKEMFLKKKNMLALLHAAELVLSLTKYSTR